MARTGWLCRLLLAGLSLGLAPAHAQTTVQTPPADAWASGCTASARNAPLDCSVAQRVVDSATGHLLAEVRIRVPGDTKSPVMLVEMPLGVYLPGQITLSVDGAPAATIAFQTCDPDGCYAGTEVAASILNALLKGQTLDLQVKNQARQPTSVPISLAGFAKAYGAIQ